MVTQVCKKKAKDDDDDEGIMQTEIRYVERHKRKSSY
jgi:hypothetical protein